MFFKLKFLIWFPGAGDREALRSRCSEGFQARSLRASSQVPSSTMNLEEAIRELLVFYRMANFDIRQNSNIRYRRIATILPEYQLFHQNTQFPTRIHNSLPEYQNKLPEYQNKLDHPQIPLKIGTIPWKSDYGRGIKSYSWNTRLKWTVLQSWE